MNRSKRTAFVFIDTAQQETAKQVLLSHNVAFTANLRFPYWLETTAKTANKFNLTSKLTYFKCMSHR